MPNSKMFYSFIITIFLTNKFNNKVFMAYKKCAFNYINVKHTQHFPQFWSISFAYINVTLHTRFHATICPKTTLLKYI